MRQEASHFHKILFKIASRLHRNSVKKSSDVSSRSFCSVSFVSCLQLLFTFVINMYFV